MFGSNTQVLKQVGNLVLTKSVQHGYGRTSSGRGTIKTTISYSVYLINQDETEDYSGVYGIKNKSEALKTFNQVKRGGFASLVQTA